jgi:hypothetical protein
MGRDGNGDEGISGGGSRDMAETGESWSSVSSSPSLSTSHRHFIALFVRLARGMVQVDSEAVADSGLGGAEGNLRGAVLKRAGAALTRAGAAMARAGAAMARAGAAMAGVYWASTGRRSCLCACGSA